MLFTIQLMKTSTFVRALSIIQHTIRLCQLILKKIFYLNLIGCIIIYNYFLLQSSFSLLLTNPTIVIIKPKMTAKYSKPSKFEFGFNEIIPPAKVISIPQFLTALSSIPIQSCFSSPANNI